MPSVGNAEVARRIVDLLPTSCLKVIVSNCQLRIAIKIYLSQWLSRLIVLADDLVACAVDASQSFRDHVGGRDSITCSYPQDPCSGALASGLRFLKVRVAQLKFAKSTTTPK